MCDCSKKGEKTTNRKKDQKNTCAKNWDPYNAPPLRRQRETLHRMVGTTFTGWSEQRREKNPEIQG
ncbi:hypothetical protein, partial [Escherichia coli]|uniref:hypothetical protein n=1 Tax=Escherichia coli TaxID=562 RepID=UPI001BC88F58